MGAFNNKLQFQTVVPRCHLEDQYCIVCEIVAGVVDKLREGETTIHGFCISTALITAIMLMTVRVW